jgi:hypothetical protein
MPGSRWLLLYEVEMKNMVVAHALIFTLSLQQYQSGGSPMHMPRSSSPLRVILAFVLPGILCFGACHSASPGEKSLQAYRRNVPKFEALLPQWSKFVSDAEEKNFQEKPIGPVKGKIIFLGRVFDTARDKDAPAELYFKNQLSDLHDAGLIASSPEEVGTIVFVHTLSDQSKLYERLRVYASHKFHVFVVDAATGEIKGATELKVDKFAPPSSIKSTVSLYPYEKLDKFIESLSRRKG